MKLLDGVIVLSIGELAYRAGVSRRMLRHWDDIGLLKPAMVDPAAGHRWDMPSQVGRVRAIAALRAVGCGLDEISDLLDAELTADRLLALLRTREAELVAQVDDASHRLTEVRERLRSIENRSFPDHHEHPGAHTAAGSESEASRERT